MGYRAPPHEIEAALRRWASTKPVEGELEIPAISIALPEAREDRDAELMRREEDDRYDEDE